MIKKLLIAVLAAFIVPGAAMAFSVGTETITDYGIAASGFNYISEVQFDDGFIGWLDVGSWGHTLSPNYMTVPDNFTVNQATIQVQGWRYSGFGGEIIAVGGTLQWSGLQGWQCVSYTDNTFDLTTINSSFWNSSPLYVCLMPLFEAGISLTSSTLSIDYDEANFVSGDPAGGHTSVPEPASLLLLGLGLVTAGSWRYCRK